MTGPLSQPILEHSVLVLLSSRSQSEWQDMVWNGTLCLLPMLHHQGGVPKGEMLCLCENTKKKKKGPNHNHWCKQSCLFG